MELQRVSEWMRRSKHIICLKILLIEILHMEQKDGFWNFKECAKDLLVLKLNTYLIMTSVEVTLFHLCSKSIYIIYLSNLF